MAINKFQRSRLTFALSAKVAHIVVSSIYKKHSFLQTIGPIELKFHVKTPYDKSAKLYTKYVSHMTKMATTPIYGKNLLKIFFSRTRRPVTLRLDMSYWGCGAYQFCSNDDPRVTLTYLTSRSSLLPNGFEWIFFEKLIF